MNELGLGGFFTVRDIANEVTDTTIEMYGANGSQDDSDAFRHIYLTCVLYERISKYFSQKLMTDHESENTNVVDKNMDLHNNARGLILYEKRVNIGKPGSLKGFISHCVYNGHFYNIKKILVTNDESSLIYTEKGVDNSAYAEKCISNICIDSKTSKMYEKDYQWYKFSSENKGGILKVFSTGNVDLIVELYSSRTNTGVFIDKDDDGGEGRNFGLYFELSYYETIYIKVGGYSDSKFGEYQLSISYVNVTEAPPYRYIRHNKKKHIKISPIGKTIEEPHVIPSGTERYTSCILCGESLDRTKDGPFFVKLSNNNKKLLSAYNVLDIQLTKDEWEKYVIGTFFEDKRFLI